MPVIQIAENVKRAELGSSPLVTLRGSDADSDDNGKIEFSFQQEIDLFEIDTNGEIFMKREFSNRDENMIMIPITIRDLGNPCLFTKYNIFILRSNESFNATALTMMIQEKQQTLSGTCHDKAIDSGPKNVRIDCFLLPNIPRVHWHIDPCCTPESILDWVPHFSGSQRAGSGTDHTI